MVGTSQGLAWTKQSTVRPHNTRTICLPLHGLSKQTRQRQVPAIEPHYVQINWVVSVRVRFHWRVKSRTKERRCCWRQMPCLDTVCVTGRVRVCSLWC